MARVDQLDRRMGGLLGSGDDPVEHRIFINCWTAQDSESHAMWNLYCSSRGGVAIQTTLPALIESVPNFRSFL
jgi:hypothetical protein